MILSLIYHPQRWGEAKLAHEYSLEKALEIDKTLGEAHNSLAYISWRQLSNFHPEKRKSCLPLAMLLPYQAKEMRPSKYWTG